MTFKCKLAVFLGHHVGFLFERSDWQGEGLYGDAYSGTGIASKKYSSDHL